MKTPDPFMLFDLFMLSPVRCSGCRAVVMDNEPPIGGAAEKARESAMPCLQVALDRPPPDSQKDSLGEGLDVNVLIA